MIKKMIYIAIGGALFLLGGIYLANIWVEQSTQKQLFNDIDRLPQNKVALVLGTIRLINGKYKNPYFYNRIEAAVRLYQSKKVQHIIVSGDNHRKGYNEPEDMQLALIQAGIPESAITLDYAGFRTLDSVVRSKAIFQQDKITIVSQAFHNHRAVFIANQKGIDAIAYNAQDVYRGKWSKLKFREYVARFLAILDIWVWNKQPKFYGKKINIKI